MNSRHIRSPREYWRSVTLGGAVVSVAAMLTGCSASEDQEYATPDSLCGVSVKSDQLTPFLPPGKKVSSQQSSPNGGTDRCKISVDGKPVIIAGQIWWDERDSVINVANVHARVESDHVTDDKKYLYSGTGAVGRSDGCTDSEHPDQNLFTTIQVFTSEADDTPAMKSLIKKYTEEIEGSSACLSGQEASKP